MKRRTKRFIPSPLSRLVIPLLLALLLLALLATLLLVGLAVLGWTPASQPAWIGV